MSAKLDKKNVQLTSSKIGALWGEYVNVTTAEVVNKYMITIIEDEVISALFKEAISSEDFNDGFFGKGRPKAFSKQRLFFLSLIGFVQHIKTIIYHSCFSFSPSQP
jgi:hypothetical protein